jgi:adenylate cyclase class 2
MNIEYEIRVLEVDKEKLIKRLEELGAQFIGDFDQKRYVFDTIPTVESKWIRLRTNGKNSTLTYKSVEKATIDGTQEIEVEVSDFEKTRELLEACGIKHRGYQENRRNQYILDDVEIDIDSWPMIPTYVEIEGKDEQSVMKMVDKLELDKSKLTALDVMSVYDQIYHIDMNKIKHLKF